jgi:hypothetical protein
MRFIVDIDGTIFNSPSSNYTESTPYLDRIAKINKLYDEGHEIIYWTARGGSSGIDWHYFTVKQLFEYGCKYHELKMGKPQYDMWIDDKAFRAEEFFKLVE